MPRRRGSNHPGPAPRARLPPPPGLSEEARLMWQTEDEMEDALNPPIQRRRRLSIDPRPIPPPSPRLRDNVASLSEPEEAPLLSPLSPREPAPSGGVSPISGEFVLGPGPSYDAQVKRVMDAMRAQEERAKAESSRNNEEGERRELSRRLVFGGQAEQEEASSEQRADEQRRREGRRRRNMERFVNSAGPANERPAGEDDGTRLKPLTPLSQGQQQQQQQQQQQTRKPGIMRRRGIPSGRIDVNKANELSQEEMDWMTDSPAIRNYANWGQESLYGKDTQDIAHTLMFHPYPAPSRDIDQINQNIRDMTLNEQKYQIGGPPTPMNVSRVDYLTDISGIRDNANLERAREAKRLSAYTLFTERQDEIDMLHRLKAQGALKDDVEIKYGYQQQGPHGAIAWLTHEGQEIGARQRQQYEREKALEEARKQAEAEAEYNQWVEEEQRKHESLDGTTSDDPDDLDEYFLSPFAYPPSRSSNIKSTRKTAAWPVVKRCDSDDSVKTAYRVGETVPDSAYRDSPDRASDSIDEQSSKLTVSAPAPTSADKDAPDSPLITED